MYEVEGQIILLLSLNRNGTQWKKMDHNPFHTWLNPNFLP